MLLVLMVESLCVCLFLFIVVMVWKMLCSLNDVIGCIVFSFRRIGVFGFDWCCVVIRGVCWMMFFWIVVVVWILLSEGSCIFMVLLVD